MKRFEAYIGLGLLLFSIGFNLWIYRMEPTALADPNDNTFQYALVHRTNDIWEYAAKTCHGITKPFCMVSHLTDHWVPNWAEGYNLPYYYSHIPQIVIVTTYRLISGFSIFIFQFQISVFQYYHWMIYLLLCLFPLSVFFALRTIRLSPIVAGIGALMASHLSTDGLYGLDPTSFLWRGYGLSSQLFAMVWLPLALAYAYTYFIHEQDKKSTYIHAIAPILFLALTTAGHLGIGIIAFMSIGIIAVSPFMHTILAQQWDKHMTRHLFLTLTKLVIVFGTVGLLLGYWILPILKDGVYHNISVWDGIWKFDSFGYREVLKNLMNGDLFDFNRFPILTMLVFVGIFASIVTPHYAAFAFLFLFWLLMYFGRVTWGGLFNLIPGMSEFHLSRFIVGVHIAGIFLIPIGIDWTLTAVQRLYNPKNMFIHVLATLSLCVFVTLLVIPQTLRYTSHNDFLIARGNQNYTKDKDDVSLLLKSIHQELKTHPGRVFAGRGGSWGKNFRIAETPMYMHLSTYGIPVILWLPETWSPNSDTEQYFSEGNKDHYALYNVSLVATQADLAKEHIQPFWRLLKTGKTWKLYSVDSSSVVIPSEVEGSRPNNSSFGYITSGVRPAIVSSDKENFRNVIRLWMHGIYPIQKLYPQLTFNPAYPRTTGLPNFRMLDEATFKVPDGSVHSLFAEVPHYINPTSSESALPIITSQSSDHDMTFKASIDIKEPCKECIVILKQSFHPSWRATVDGTSVTPFAVFPFFIAISLETPGTHEIIFTYQPSLLKEFLLLVGYITCGGILWLVYRARIKKH